MKKPSNGQLEYISAMAVDILLKQKRHRLPIDPFTFSHDICIKVDFLESYTKHANTTLNQISKDFEIEDGIFVNKGNINLILLKQKYTNIKRQKFTLAHELGHIYLGHKEQTLQNEKEANFFAVEILMPRIFLLWLHDKGLMNSLLLEHLLGVSTAAAEKRAREFSPGFTCSEKEKELLEIYKPLLINQNTVTV